MSSEPTFNHSDLEALSAYIDDMLPKAERAELEARLQQEPELRRELNALRQTVRLVQRLPRLKAPRDFTLTEDMLAQDNEEKLSLIRRVRSIPRNVIQLPTLSLVSAAASVALVLLGFLLIYGYEQNNQLVFSEIVAGFGDGASSTVPDDRSEDRSQADNTVAMAPTPTRKPSDQTAAASNEVDENSAIEELVSGLEGGAADTDTAEAGIMSEQPELEESDLVMTAIPPVQAAAGISADEAQIMEPVTPEFSLPFEVEGTPDADPFAMRAITTEAAQAQESASENIPQTLDVLNQAQATVDALDMQTQIAQSPAQDETRIAGLTNDAEAASKTATQTAMTNASAPEPQSDLAQPSEREQDQYFEETDQTDLTVVGIILIVTGLLLAVMTFLIRQLRNSRNGE